MKRTELKKISKKRKASDSAYYAAKKIYMTEHPICERCHSARSDDLDHIANQSQSPAARMDQGNWQALCRSCHDWKTTHFDDAVAEGHAVKGWAYRQQREAS